MLWPVLLRVAVAFPVPEAPPAQIEAVDAIRTLVVYILPLRGGKTGSTPCGPIKHPYLRYMQSQKDKSIHKNSYVATYSNHRYSTLYAVMDQATGRVNMTYLNSISTHVAYVSKTLR